MNMSGWGDDDPDNERGEAIKDRRASVSGRADSDPSSPGARNQRAAVLPDQSAGEETRSQGSGSRQRGRTCKREVSEKTIKQIIELAQGKYKGFNDHHLTDKCASDEK